MKFVEKGVEQVGIEDRTASTAIAGLLQVDADDVEKALCSRVVAARGDVVVKGHNISEAMNGRDAFAKVFNCLCVIAKVVVALTIDYILRNI